jgi:hypothetical protein
MRFENRNICIENFLQASQPLNARLKTWSRDCKCSRLQFVSSTNNLKTKKQVVWARDKCLGRRSKVEYDAAGHIKLVEIVAVTGHPATTPERVTPVSAIGSSSEVDWSISNLTAEAKARS